MNLRIEKQRDILATAFGVSALSPGQTFLKMGEMEGNVIVESVWTVNVDGYWQLPVTVSRVKYSNFFGKRDIDFALLSCKECVSQ